MGAVVVNPPFARAVEGQAAEPSMNFGIVRRLFASNGDALEGGKIYDVARINGLGTYTRLKFIDAVQRLIIDDLRKLNEGEGGIEYPEDAYTAEYLIGAVDHQGVISNYATIEVTGQEDWFDFRQEIEDSIQHELEQGVLQGNDTRGLIRLYEVNFRTNSVPAAGLECKG